MAILKNTVSLAIVAALVLLLAGLAHAGRAPLSTGKVERGLRARQQHAERLLAEGPTCAGSGSVTTGNSCTAAADCADVDDSCSASSNGFVCWPQCVGNGGIIANGDAPCSCCSGQGQGADSFSAGMERCA